MLLDRYHLSILREVDRSGSVTAAAERLNVTQSAVSHTMRKLEEHYGVEVWTKKGRNLCLTPAGQDLLEVARRVLPQFEHAEGLLTSYSRGKSGALRAGMECHPCQSGSCGFRRPS